MIIVMDETTARKKKFKKVYKVIISLSIDKEIDKRSTIITTLVPQVDTFRHFIYGKFKKYNTEYIDMIKQNDDLYATILTLIMAYKEHGILALVCDDEEYTYKYTLMLADFIKERYGIKFITNSDAKNMKDIDLIEKCKINNKFKKDLAKYGDLIFGGISVEEAYENTEHKKHKKIKDKKKHKKDKKEHRKVRVIKLKNLEG